MTRAFRNLPISDKPETKKICYEEPGVIYCKWNLRGQSDEDGKQEEDEPANDAAK